jgi:sugar-specific transcriptional regulator TrmB
MDLSDCLVETGLTRLEAQLYLLLNSEGVMTGYEAAKLTGISRSNAYMGLAGLTEKGGAVCIDGDVRRYAAVPPEEYCSNKRRRHEEVLKSILDLMPTIRPVTEPFMTIKGRTHILNKMRNLIDDAQYRIYLALAADDVRLVLPELEQLRDRGRKVVLITSPPLTIAGITVYHADKKPGQIRMIVDSSVVLTGELDGDEGSCLFSRHQALVTLFKESMINEIQLISMAGAGSPMAPMVSIVPDDSGPGHSAH